MLVAGSCPSQPVLLSAGSLVKTSPAQNKTSPFKEGRGKQSHKRKVKLHKRVLRCIPAAAFPLFPYRPAVPLRPRSCARLINNVSAPRAAQRSAPSTVYPQDAPLRRRRGHLRADAGSDCVCQRRCLFALSAGECFSPTPISLQIIAHYHSTESHLHTSLMQHRRWCVTGYHDGGDGGDGGGEDVMFA